MYDIPFVCAYSWRPGCCFHSCLCVCEDIKRPPWSYLESGAINNIQGIYWKFLSINNVLLQNKRVASMYPTLSWKPSLFFHISCYDKNSLLVVTLNDASARFKSSSCNQHFSLNWKRFSYQSSHFQRWWCINNNWFPEEVFCAMCLALPYFIAPRRQPWIYHRFCPLFSSHLDLDLEHLWSM